MRQYLSRDRICKAAITLIDQQGLENLSMRKLATKLKVEAASLYNHIKNKSELFDLIQEKLYSMIEAPKLGKSWQEHLHSLAHATRKGLLCYPELVALFATRPTVAESSLLQVEITLRVLIESGFKSGDALLIFRNINVFVLGHVLAEVGQVPGKDNGDEPSLSAINLDHYPTLKSVFIEKHAVNFDKGFKQGLNNLIAGLEQQLHQEH